MRLSSKSHNFVNLNLIYKSITRVPAIIITRPMLDFTDSFSLKTMYEKTIETQLCLTYQSAQLHLQDRLARPYSNTATNRLSQRLKGRCRQVRFWVLSFTVCCFPFAKTSSQAIIRTTLVRIAVPRFDSAPSMPIFPSIDVRLANTAERTA